MIPAEAMIISTFRLIDGWQLLNTIIGLLAVVHRDGAALHHLDAAGASSTACRSSWKRP